MSAGYDSHAGDLLGSLALTTGFYTTMLDRLADIQPRMVVALEGGYRLDAVARSAVAQLGSLSGNPFARDEPASKGADVEPVLRDARRAHRLYWNL